jgi:two-component system CheB/CheR fusion protein
VTRETAENPFPIAGVGASAGGLDALSRLVAALPPEPGLAIVVIQHLDPRHESHLTELLEGKSKVPVVDAEHGMKVKPDHVYAIQPNTNVAIADGVLSVTPRPDNKNPHYPVDHFLRSLADVQGPMAVGVILSGTGSDGTFGLAEIKAAGGLTFAQDDVSAEHRGMPQSAIAAGAVDLVLPPEEIAARLASLLEHPYLVEASPETLLEQDEEDGFRRVIEALRKRSGVDFSQYRDTTLKRRTARRMLLRAVNNPADYAKIIETDSDEAQALYRDVLINVTSFFREPEMFEELKKTVFPSIVKNNPDARRIRAWVPGCSTGQEAYSLAIVLFEFLEDHKLSREIQIFATDLGDATSLDRARAGFYPESIEAEVSAERLRRFFTREADGYRIEKHVRDRVVFARQNLMVDPPFSRVDIVSCRNVMIYMSTPLQDRLVPVFHFALNQRGFLVLGVAESVGRFGDLFEPASRTQKIFRRKDAAGWPQIRSHSDMWTPAIVPRVGAQPAVEVDFAHEAERVALNLYSPPSVLVNSEFEVEHFRGKVSPFLEIPTGQPTASILRMAREGLFMELRSALQEAKASRAPIMREHLHVSDAGQDLEFTLRVVPVNAPRSEDLRLLVLFETRDWPQWTAPPAAPSADGGDRDAASLRQELASSKQYLQAILDSQEAANQELRAAHEEVLSSNEELQSTNEELETTKEELQSTNEELTTVNEQFQTRNAALDQLADDLSNFIDSSDVPLLTVNRDLKIRRVTPAAHRVFNALPTDVGRPLDHIHFSLVFDKIREVVTSVVDTSQAWERELVDREGKWWLLRVRPYLTADSRIDGATLVAIDIDSIKRNADLTESRDYALAVLQTVREPLIVLDAECHVGLANDAYYKLFEEDPAVIGGKVIWDTGRGVWADPSLRKTVAAACRGESAMVNVEVQRPLGSKGMRTLVINARTINRPDRPGLLLMSIDDVTEMRQAERLRIDAETLRLVDRRKDEFLGILAHELRNPLAPMRFALEALRRSDGSEADILRSQQVLERQINHMVRIVDDLLDVSRITQGKIELRKEPLSLASIVHAAVELSRPMIDASHHELAVSLPDEPVVINGDSVRLTQVLVNLLNNAVKFTPAKGHIWLIADLRGEDPANPDQVRIRVRDTGIGIAPEALDRVFEMFMQGDRSLERTRGGLGVGLTLVRNLVALHGGSVEAWSEGQGHGSEFSITLPVETQQAPGEKPAPLPTPQAAARKLKILVADDNDDGRQMLKFLLESEGHQVAVAEDGTEALKAAAEMKPEVGILDIGMPGMNGYEVARTLKKGRGKKPFLIALSGLGQADDKARALGSGFDHHFTKPVDLNALLSIIAQRVK